MRHATATAETLSASTPLPFPGRQHSAAAAANDTMEWFEGNESPDGGGMSRPANS